MDPVSFSIQILLTPAAVMLMMLGTALGVVVGAIPGLTGAMLIALSLPLTFGMNSELALVLLVSMYVGSVSGGLVTATLLRMPGTPASIMTTLDGYPLAKSGRPGRALGLGVFASFFGGMFSWVVLVLLARPMADWSVSLGPFELFSLVLMALVLIASVGGRSLSKGLFSGFLGILAAMPGTSPATGEFRLTFGFHELDGGFELLPVLIGMFAISQIVSELWNLHQPVERIEVAERGLVWRWRDWWEQKINLLRSSAIGTWIGILPGIGANIGSVVAYSVAKNSSKDPQKFGQGSEEGIVASEAANNATIGGALIPLIALGIPGSVIDAILLGALVIHELQPGPVLFSQHPEIVYVIMGAMLAANFFMLVFLWFTARWLGRLATVPRAILVPAILTFCVVGSFALHNRMFDVWVMLGFGVLGILLEKVQIPLAPFVIGFVLEPIAEKEISAGLMQSGGSWLPLVTRPISLIFCLISVVLFVWTLRRHWQTRGRDDTIVPETDTDA